MQGPDAGAVRQRRAGDEHVLAPGHLLDHRPVQLVQLWPVAPPGRPGPEAGHVPGRRGGHLEPRRGLDQRHQLAGQVAAPTHQVLSPPPAQLHVAVVAQQRAGSHALDRGEVLQGVAWPAPAPAWWPGTGCFSSPCLGRGHGPRVGA
jgi:hypothetical protein